ncbi:MAG: PQQ-binding-like beta-propeller repeat protein [Pirellulaceae bacterium]
MAGVVAMLTDEQAIPIFVHETELGKSMSIRHVILYVIAIWGLATLLLAGEVSGQQWSREGTDWPGFLGPARDGKSIETGLQFDWTNRPPPLIWSYRVGEGYGSGSVASGQFFHFDRDGDEARLTALNAETGEVLWQFTYPTDYVDIYGFDGGPRSSPVIDGERVYVHGVEGMLHCLDVSNGEVIWKIDTQEKYGVIQNFFGVGSTPLVYDDLLITMIGGSPEASQTVPLGQLDRVEPNGSAIVAFNKFTGEERYRTIDDLASYCSPVVTQIEGRDAIIALCRSALHGFDPRDGEALWQVPYRATKFESVNASTPVVFGDRVMITESYGIGGAVLELASESADFVWADERLRDASLACHWNTPIVHGGFAWASHGEGQSNAELRCIDLGDGSVRWSEPGLTRSSLTWAQGHLICLGENGRLLALRQSEEQFELVGEVDSGHLRLVGPCWAAPVLSHGYLYVRDKNRIFCLDIHDE